MKKIELIPLKKFDYEYFNMDSRIKRAVASAYSLLPDDERQGLEKLYNIWITTPEAKELVLKINFNL